jgi:Domain of unknown function (DUF4082)/Bacterial Ig-like domain/Bacterial Ig domain
LDEFRAVAPTNISLIALLKGIEIMRRFQDCFLLLTVLCPLWLAPPALASCSSPANAIEAENCLPGTPQNTWDVSGAGDSTIQGFTTDISANVGQTVSFKISTNATNYKLDIYRLGYYGGAGAHLVTTVTPSAQLPQTQPTCITDVATALMDCGNWAVSATWTIPANATSGIYFAHVIRQDTGGASHIPFVVRNDSSTSAILFKTSDTTWQAYNDYGGANLYTGGPGPQNGAYKVSYNRPYHTRVYEFYSWIFNAEYPMVRFLEANGYDVSYFSSLDADRSGSMILQHKALLSVGHDEYWSGNERTNVEAARAAGIHLAFFSGNEVFWKTRWEPSIDGTSTANRTMVCYKETHSNRVTDPLDPPTWTGTWRDTRFSPPADGGRPENGLTGTIFMVNGPQNPLLSIQVPAADGKMRLWRNTSVATQAAGATTTFPVGTLGYEWDEDLDNGFRPAGLFELSTATYDTSGNLLLDNGSTYGPGTATHHLTMYRAPSGALVFGSGTVQWPWGLDSNHDGNATTANTSMQQATINLFADMGIQPGSLQSGLVGATKSTDTTPPSSTITSPTSGGSVQAGSLTTITGTATDVGGVVGGVEVSTDGGATWHPATGRASWTYNWTPTGSGTVTIQSRATDDSGNIETPSGGVTLTLAARSCPCTIWNSPIPSTPDGGDPAAVEVGVKFRADSNGFINGINFYKSAANTGTHVGHLWTDSGTLLATGTFTGESSSGWQKLVFSTPVAITANTSYVASYFVPNGHYSADESYFAAGGVDNAPLHALADGVDGGNGIYVYGAGNTFPTNTFQSTNYWVDVVFASSGGVDTPPTVASVSPTAGATLVAATTTVNAVFSEPVNPATISGTTFQLFGPANSLVAATVAYSSGSQTATLTPSAALAFSTTYTAVVTGGSNGVKDVAGNAMTSNFTWSFTTAAAPPPPGTCPCTVWTPTTVPGTVDGSDPTAGEYGFRFRSDVAGTITSVRFYKATSNTGTHTAHLWSNTGTLLATANFSGEGSSGWQQADFSTPVSITPSTTYVASYFAPNGHYSANNSFFVNGVDNVPLHALKDGLDGANGIYHYSTTSAFPASTFQSSNYWVDVVFVPTVSTTPPTVTSVTPTNNSTGVALTAVATAVFSETLNPATVNGTTFLLVNSSNTAIASTVTYNGTTAALTPTAALASSTTYTATVKGGANGVKDLNGNALASDFVWSFTTAADTTPPTVTSVIPAGGATGVAPTTTVNVVFSEAINATTINTSTVQLFGPSSSLVAATVTYTSASNTATLQPTAALVASTTYTVVVSGGANGVKDLAGNAMTANFTSSFTTGVASPPPGNCPCSVWATTTTPATVDSGDANTTELGFRFRSDVSGTITGMRFYKSSDNTGTHTGHLWTNTGTLMASVTFTVESGSGWQQVDFSTPVAISANTTYVASYFAPNGHYSANHSFFVTGVDNAPLHALLDGLDGANGVYNYGASSAFPASTFQSTNYWVDVIFVPTGSTTGPTVTSVTPANNTTQVALSAVATATFSEPMTASTISQTTFLMVDSSNNPVAGTVTYDVSSSTTTFKPTAGLVSANTYTVTLKSGLNGVKDFNGNPLAADFSWSFSTAPVPNNSGPGGPILVISNASNPFTRYYGEVLSAEGLNEYLVADISMVTATTLASYDIAILGDMSLTSAQVSMLTAWVNGGGRLIAMHPDKQLAGLLKLTSSTSTLSNAYLLVQTSTGPGVGIVGQSIQFHGPADQYTLNGASSLATLYSSASTPTTSPAVTLANVGSGQGAAFTYDLARSIVYTRQGNPAWSGEARDGQTGPIRSDDLYFGAASFDPEPDWVDLNKVAIPQADEQQRLLANLILQMNTAKKPLPRFWYLPSGFKAAVVMTGDDHGSFYSGTATSQRFGDLLAASPTGCSVPDWQCARSTSYLFPQIIADNSLTDAQAAAFAVQGFEISVHVDSNPTCSNWIPADLDTDYVNFMASFASQFPSVPAPKTHRMHCIGWSNYDTQPQTELRHGMRLDTSYYYWPPTWVNDVPGLFTGSGMPMRFTDRNGNIIDVYQATTQMTDESGQSYPLNIDTVLDNATGSTGYYGAFVVQAHNDQGSYPGIGPDIVSSAQAHSVPIVSAQQMLTWLDGRNNSSFGSLSWSGGTLSFTIAVGAGARNLQAMLPVSSSAGTLTSITLSGSPVSFTTQTIKGVQYAFFNASAGSYSAKYGASTFTVSGTITGTGGNGAAVTLTSGTTTVATTTANASGAYTFSNLANGSYTVTPTQTGFTFTPASQAITVNGANVTVTAFSSAAQTFTVTGTISGTGGNAATVTLTSGTTTIATVSASGAGAYAFSNVANGSYTVTPTQTGFTFTPASQAITVNGANVTVTAFSSTAVFTVTGTISGTGGNAATVTLTSGTTTIATVTASGAGAYTFSNLANGSYTVTPTKAGFTFTPASQAITVNGANLTVTAFSSSAIATGTLATDAIAFKDNTSKATTITTATFSTTSTNELLLAFVAADAPTSGTNVQVNTMTGAGLTWTLVKRTNVQRGTAEIWRAFAVAALANVSVTATLSSSQPASMTVVTFTGMDTTGTNGAGAIGATGTSNAATGAPTGNLVTTRNNSWVFAAGDDWDGSTARTVGANQTLVHQLLVNGLDTFWVQRQNATTPLSGTTVTINDTAPTNHRYNLTLVEVLPHL